MALNITGGKYALATVSVVGTTTLTTSTSTFVSGDFGTTQRMVALYTSANVFKGITWVRRFTSTTALELENQFVDPCTGLFVTQAIGDKILVSKNFVESAGTGMTVTAATRVVNTTTQLSMGTAGSETSLCFYDENYNIGINDALITLGGVTVLGKIISYDGTGLGSMIFDRGCYLEPLSTFNGAGQGSQNYTNLTTGGTAAHYFQFGGQLAGSLQGAQFAGAYGSGVGNKSFCLYGCRVNYCVTSPSQGSTWGTYAARHIMYKCFSEATYTNANLIMMGDGQWLQGTVSFPQYAAGTLGMFRSSGTANYTTPPNQRAIVSDLGQGYLIDGVKNANQTYNFTNLITPAYTTSRTGTVGANAVTANFSYADDYTNLKANTTIVVRRTVDSVVAASVVNTASSTFTASVLQAQYTATSAGAMTQVFNYTSFDYTVKCYGYAALSGNYAVTNYSLGTGGTGKNLTLGGLVNQLVDSGVTLTETNALALSSKFTIDRTTKVITVTANGNYDELYDYAVAWGCSSAANAQVPTLSQYLLTTSGANLTAYIGWSLVVNTGVTLSAGTKFNYIYVPTITLNGTAAITGIYETTAGKSTTIELRGVTSGSSIYIGDASTGITKLYQSDTSTDTYRAYFAPGDTSSQLIARELYGTQRVSEVIPLTGGLLLHQFVDIPDTKVTQTSASTVAAYTSINTTEKRYDAVALFRLSEQGIKLGQIVTAEGTSLTSTFSLVAKQTATINVSVVGNVLTIKAASYEGTSRYTKEIVTGGGTVTANTTEVLSIKIEDANGDSSCTVAGTANSLVDVWKITNATLPIDYETGTKIATDIGNGQYRFIHVDGYQLVFFNKDNGIFRYCSMSKGDYTAGWYLYDSPAGGLTTEEKTTLDSIYTKSGIIQSATTAIDEKVVLLADDVAAIPEDVWSATSRTLTSAGASGATLAEIEGSAVLAKELTAQAIKDKVDSLQNTDLSLVAKSSELETLAKETTVKSVKNSVDALQ